LGTLRALAPPEINDAYTNPAEACAMLDQGQTLATDRTAELMRSMESIPAQAYWGLAMASVLFSALLYLSGRRSSALFVGQWPPTFLALALLYKLLRPSQEQTAKRAGAQNQ
jgi:hypothetical protein